MYTVAYEQQGERQSRRNGDNRQRKKRTAKPQVFKMLPNRLFICGNQPAYELYRVGNIVRVADNAVKKEAKDYWNCGYQLFQILSKM